MTYADSHREGLGGSEVLTALGLDPRKSPLQLWSEKRGLVAPSDESDEATERGNEEEDGCLEWAERRLGHGPLIRQKSERHRYGYDAPLVRGRLLVSPDAVPWIDDGTVGIPFGVEAKTRQYSREWGEDGSGDVPIDVATQCAAYMAALKSERWYVSVLFGLPLCRRLYVIERDESRCQRILSFVEGWWQRHIVEGIAPDAVTPEDHSRRARMLYPKAGGEVLRTSAREVVALMEERRAAERAYAEAKAAFEAAEDRRRIAGGQIEELIGSAAGIETPAGSAFLNSPRTARTKLRTQWPGGIDG